MKVSELAARALRAGHPWVFREGLWRAVEGEGGALRFIVDERGRGIGWGLLESEGAIALHVLSRSERFEWNRATMRERLQRAADYRASHVEEGYAGACRLVHGAADGFPGIAVDRLGEYLLIYRYARAAESYVDELIPLLEEVFECRGIYLQDRVRSVQPDERRAGAAHVAGKPAPGELEVQEDGLTHLVDVSAPVSPGLFLDLREGRRLLEAKAAGKSVLNLFSFTGSLAM
ncbi:MAG: class I SAM-dependent methyltransferase, partial [Planctomycetota bacterium]